jgi:succinate dehydrogenase/fumarate reductase flavoprotein subunit
MDSLKKVDVRLHCKADEVILDDSGKAVGVALREGYYFDTPETDDLTNKTGTQKRVKAAQGIIYATGGYARDKAFRSVEVPFLAGVATTTNPGATSGALKSLIRAGAQSVHTSLFRFAYPMPTEDMIWGMMIDPATGERFMPESATRNDLAVTVLLRRMQNGDRKPFMIYDQKALSKFHNLNRVQRSLNGLNAIDGTMVKFEKLEDLAKYFGADPAKVQKSLDDYNALIKEGKDTVFNKELTRSGRNVEPIDAAGPFYGIVITPRLNYTPGGIRTDLKGRALRLTDGKPIEGLYVVGEAAGGLHGNERMTACSMPDCSVFAMLAAEDASARNRS